MNSVYPHALVLIVALTQTACDIKVASDNKIASDNNVPISLLGGPPTVNNYVPHSTVLSTQSTGYVPQSAIEAEKARVISKLQSMGYTPQSLADKNKAAIDMAAAEVTVARIPEVASARQPSSGGSGPSTSGVR